MQDIAGVTPNEVQETGIRRGLLEDIALKTLYLNGEMSLADLSKHMCLSVGVIDEIFQFFRKEQLCEVKGMVGGSHRIAASNQGRSRAAELLAMSQYVGPAPVSLTDYRSRVAAQTIQQTGIQPSHIEKALHPLILDAAFLARLGTAVVSGTSIFLYGPSGTGKTSIASCIPAIYNDSVWIPYAVEVDGQIITVYDPGVHRECGEAVPEDADKRWVLCQRPRILAGGELSSEMLDLQLSTSNRFYTAPLQMKANNGVLILDDFGRQRMRPDELLNRWMTPLDRRVDFLTLPGGRKFEIPFDVCVVFSTNIDPRELGDEAFIRRIPNKIRVPHAMPEQFMEIFRAECRMRLVECEPGLPEHVVKVITQELKQPLSQCYPRDLINQIFWNASYLSVEPRLTREALDKACHDYFVTAPKS
ncbi:MAG TPA: hypothetical protein VGR97_10795 [Candidatus Acidoferrales bacterium]|nr:hypothetical protein [Candidatus Acidoferrales bacterium]